MMASARPKRPLIQHTQARGMAVVNVLMRVLLGLPFPTPLSFQHRSASNTAQRAVDADFLSWSQDWYALPATAELCATGSSAPHARRRQIQARMIRADRTIRAQNATEAGFMGINRRRPASAPRHPTSAL